jgi:hypothetical protein
MPHADTNLEATLPGFDAAAQIIFARFDTAGF